jgi:hypothetical protein
VRPNVNPDWAKLYETLTKPLPVATSLFLLVVSSVVLLGPIKLVEALGISAALGQYHWTVGLVFLIAVGWLAVSALLFVGRRLFDKWQQRKRRQRLHHLTTDERGILRPYVQNHYRSYPIVEGHLGIAQGLADDGILYRPQLPTQPTAFVPYNIVEWALEYLTKHPQLLAETVPAVR